MTDLSDAKPNPRARDLGSESRTKSLDVSVVKSDLRRRMRDWLRTVTAEMRSGASRRACARLEEADAWQRSETVLVYAPRNDELDIKDLIASALLAGKVVTLPQYDAATGCYRACRVEVPLNELPLGRYGIREPGTDCNEVSLNRLDLALVPGLAFDLAGHRLGRGRGYYDRLLAGLGAMKCGLGFDEQIQPQIPMEPHDVVLDCILTPTRWVTVHPRGHGNDVVG